MKQGERSREQSCVALKGKFREALSEHGLMIFNEQVTDLWSQARWEDAITVASTLGRHSHSHKHVGKTQSQWRLNRLPAAPAECTLPLTATVYRLRPHPPPGGITASLLFGFPVPLARADRENLRCFWRTSKRGQAAGFVVPMIRLAWRMGQLTRTATALRCSDLKVRHLLWRMNETPVRAYPWFDG